jgi:hypothetical protein
MMMMRNQKGPDRRPSANAQPPDWETLRNPGLRHRPQWKRFTIDVPVELHRGIKVGCAYHGLEMAAWMRRLLEINVARLENSPRK